MRNDPSGPRSRGLLLGAVLTVLGLALAAAGLLSGGSAWATPSASDCLAGSSGVQTHFETGGATAGGMPQITGLVLSGFDPASCDGLPVRDILSGNSAGDPSLNATDLHPLSTLDSSKDPCTGADATSPVTIANGTIRLVGCAAVSDSAGAAYASIHDVTQQQIFVDGIALVSPPNQPPTGTGGQPQVSPPKGTGTGTGGQTQVSPPKGTGTGGHTQVSPPKGTGTATGTGNATLTATGQGVQQGVLAQTGGPPGILLLLGIVLVVLGAALLLEGRRRRRPVVHQH